MNIRRLAGIAALGLSTLAISFPPPAHAATTRSDPTGCTIGSSKGNVNTCMTWNASGSVIKFIDGIAEVNNATRELKVCVHSSVVGTLACNPGGYIALTPGHHIAATWNPGRPELAATYCVRTWRKNNSGSVTLIGEVCTFIS